MENPEKLFDWSAPVSDISKIERASAVRVRRDGRGVYLGIVGYSAATDESGVGATVLLPPEAVRALGLALNLASAKDDESQKA